MLGRVRQAVQHVIAHRLCEIGRIDMDKLRAQAIAEKAGKRLPTVSPDVEIRLRSPPWGSA